MNRRNLIFVAAGLLVSLLLAGVVSFYASGSPDGLEKVAEDKGFLSSATEHEFEHWPLAGYAIRGIDDERLSGGLAGVAGVLITLVVAGGLFRLLARSRGSDATDDAPAAPR